MSIYYSVAENVADEKLKQLKDSELFKKIMEIKRKKN